MSDYKNYVLDELCVITRGASPRPIHDYISKTGTPWVKIADANANPRFISSTNDNIIPEGETKSRIVYPGDFIVSNSATPGLPRFMKIRACVHDGWLIIRELNESILNRWYLYYRLILDREHLLSLGNGSIFTNLKTDILKQHSLSLPSIKVQIAVVDVLSSIDDKIDLLNRQNETLESMAQTLFRQWFIVEADESWEEKRLDEVCTVSIGKTPPRKEPHWFSSDAGIPWLSIKDMGSKGVYAIATSEYLTEGATQKFNVKVVPEGAVLLSFKLTVGRVSITAAEMCTNEAIAHFYNVNNQHSTNHFIYLFLKQFNFSSLGSTSSIAEAVNSKTVKGIKIIVPTNDRLNSFESVVKPMFDKILSNSKMISTLTLKRDALLPKLMSGEVRVKLD